MMLTVKDLLKKAVEQQKELLFDVYTNKKKTKKDREHNQYITDILSPLDGTDFSFEVVNVRGNKATIKITYEAVLYLNNYYISLEQEIN